MTPTVNVRVPFTAAQRQELERQTMIYKYMMASIPVPPELLIPITKKNAPPSQSNSNILLYLIFLVLSNFHQKFFCQF